MPRDPRATIPCLCAGVRAAARAVTRLYDRHIGASGLGATQFTLLKALDSAGPRTQSELAYLLSADSTTLTRTLGPLMDRGLLTQHPGEDRREKVWSITAEGRRVLSAATPAWEAAQASMRGRRGLTSDEWRELLRLLVKATAAAEASAA